MFDITVWQITGGVRTDIAFFATVASAPEVEDTVTDLHRRFPASQYEVEVRSPCQRGWR